MLRFECNLNADAALLEAKLKLSQAQIETALKRALKSTARWLETQMRRELGRSLKVPVKALKVRFKHKVHVNSADRHLDVWFGANPLPASYLGHPSQNRRGTRAGRHQFEGAFAARMSSSHIGVYRRSSARRLPIKTVRLEINETSQPVFDQICRQAPARLIHGLKKELRFLLGGKG